MNVRPLADRVVIRPLEAEEIKKGGIIMAMLGHLCNSRCYRAVAIWYDPVD